MQWYAAQDVSVGEGDGGCVKSHGVHDGMGRRWCMLDGETVGCCSVEQQGQRGNMHVTDIVWCCAGTCQGGAVQVEGSYTTFTGCSFRTNQAVHP